RRAADRGRALLSPQRGAGPLPIAELLQRGCVRAGVARGIATLRVLAGHGAGGRHDAVALAVAARAVADARGSGADGLALDGRASALLASEIACFALAKAVVVAADAVGADGGLALVARAARGAQAALRNTEAAARAVVARCAVRVLGA